MKTGIRVVPNAKSETRPFPSSNVGSQTEKIKKGKGGGVVPRDNQELEASAHGSTVRRNFQCPEVAVSELDRIDGLTGSHDPCLRGSQIESFDVDATNNPANKKPVKLRGCEAPIVTLVIAGESSGQRMSITVDGDQPQRTWSLRVTFSCDSSVNRSISP
jgi:hypothetical protein